MVHLEMEDKIQEHEMGAAENEDANMDFLRPEHVKTLMLVKIRAFGGMIKLVREKTIELYEKRKINERPKDDLPMQEEKKTALTVIKENEENKDQSSS